MNSYLACSGFIGSSGLPVGKNVVIGENSGKKTDVPRSGGCISGLYLASFDFGLEFW